MTNVEAIIRPDRLEEVQAALGDIGIHSMSITEIRGAGKQRGLTQHYRGTEYTVNLRHKVKLEIVVPDQTARKVAETIAEAARTGEIGDGKVFLIPVQEAIRICTGEEGNVAVI